MPEPPKKGEKHDDFIDRCMSHEIGKEGMEPDQARAVCESMWKQSKNIKLTTDDLIKIARINQE